LFQKKIPAINLKMLKNFLKTDFSRSKKMPIYEYNCKKCNINFESLVMSDETPECPKCGSSGVARLMSACGFVSKGVSSGGEAPTLKSSAGSSPCSSCTAGNCSSCGM
jgi:putative FmdB family regulatory protein